MTKAEQLKQKKIYVLKQPSQNPDINFKKCCERRKCLI